MSDYRMPEPGPFWPTALEIIAAVIVLPFALLLSLPERWRERRRRRQPA